MKNSFIDNIFGKKASDINSSYKINCFTTVVSYFNNEIQNGCMTAQEMLNWLQCHTIQVDMATQDTVAVVWFTSDQALSPDIILISDLLIKTDGYPFGLIMEHAAVFITPLEVFQKASPEDDDTFEVISFDQLIQNYSQTSWVRFTYHKMSG